MTLYKLNSDEVAEHGFTYVAKIGIADINVGVAATTLMTAVAGDLWSYPLAAVYVKTAIAGASNVTGSVGENITGSYAATAVASTTFHSQAAGDVVAPIVVTSATPTSPVAPAVGKVIQLNLTTVTGTATAGELWIYLNVHKLGSKVANL